MLMKELKNFILGLANLIELQEKGIIFKFRDEKLRQYYKQAIEWDPNNERLSKHRPLLRY